MYEKVELFYLYHIIVSHTCMLIHILQIESLKHRLDQFRDVVIANFPTQAHLIPSSDEVCLDKLQDVLLTSDTCSTAQKE